MEKFTIITDVHTQRQTSFRSVSVLTGKTRKALAVLGYSSLISLMTVDISHKPDGGWRKNHCVKDEYMAATHPRPQSQTTGSN